MPPTASPPRQDHATKSPDSGDRRLHTSGDEATADSTRRARNRNGVTLLELLVVLVLMALSAAVVLPALTSTSASAIARQNSMGDEALGAQGNLMPVDASIDPVLTTARRLAIKRGEPLRVRVDRDGVWAIVPMNGGPALEDGRVELPLSWLPDISVSALGTCVLSGALSPPTGARNWDALSCRWRSRT